VGTVIGNRRVVRLLKSEIGAGLACAAGWPHSARGWVSAQLGFAVRDIRVNVDDRY
jgi:hypothetical protein